MTPQERESYRLGRQGFERGDLDVTLDNLERLLRTCRGYADVHYMLGVAYERRGEHTAAAGSLEEAVRINPSYAEAILALSAVYESQGRYDAARELAERSGGVLAGGDERLDPTTRGKLANLHAAVGDAYAQVGDLREAIVAYRKALDRCPEYHDIRLRLGVVLRDAGFPDRAIRELERLRRVRPQLLDAAVQLGLTYFTLGQTERALSEWNAVLECDPSRDDARMYIRMVRGRMAEDRDPEKPPETAPEALEIEFDFD